MLQILFTEPVALVKNPNTMKIDPLQFNYSSGKHFLAVFIHLPTYLQSQYWSLFWEQYVTFEKN